jgi:hypothetical protein
MSRWSPVQIAVVVGVVLALALGAGADWVVPF